MKKNEAKRKARKKQTAEDFTPLKLVNEILDRLSKESNNEVWAENKTFVDPACGNGNFLIEVLKRKLKLKHDPLTALSTIYGTDIMIDNINECRLRLIKTMAVHVKENNLPKPDPLTVIKIVIMNVKCTPLKTYANGSLDYNFRFNDKANDERAKRVLDKIRKEKLLDQVNIT